jgi:hypothetical protein
MDIPLFVGFASSGPLKIPVRIESEQDFKSVFGPDVRLAWDSERGEWLYSLLGKTVTAFFKNGGRRCWVLRTVGDNITANRFLLPSVLTVNFGETNEGNGNGDARMDEWKIEQAMVQARSEGSWSDGLEIRTDLQIRSVSINDVVFTDDAGQPIEALIALQGQEQVRKGDLVKITFSDNDATLFFSVSDVQAEEHLSSPSLSSVLNLHIKGVTPTWVKPLKAGGSVVSGAIADAWTYRGSELAEAEGKPLSRECSLDVDAEKMMLQFDLEDPPILVTGDLVRVHAAGDSRDFWVSVEDAREVQRDENGNGTVFEVSGMAFTVSKALEGSLPSEPQTAELLTFDLVVRQQNDRLWRMPDLGFVKAHSRWWGALKTDAQRFEPEVDRTIRRPVDVNNTAEGRMEFASTGLFPLGAMTGTVGYSIPIGMIGLRYFSPAVPQKRHPLERDGLDVWACELFVDEELANLRVNTILSHAEAIQYLQPITRRLNGIHAALALEEVTILAAPDAVHPGWTFIGKEPCSRIGNETSPPGEEPHWCSEVIRSERVTTDPCGKSEFEPCRRLKVSPRWADVRGPKALLQLFWEADDVGQFLVQTAGEPSFSEPEVVYRGTEKCVRLQGWSLAEAYFRVRVEDDVGFSQWSSILKVTASNEPRWDVLRPDLEVSRDVIAVHRAMLRMCAARGDIFAVLSMPERYREEHAIAHANALRALISQAEAVSYLDSMIPTLSEAEANCLSFGALYFPWCLADIDHNGQTFRIVPPDGYVCGMMATRALSRGAWIPSANEVWKGVVGTANPPAQDVQLDESLADARVNVVTHEPVGVLVLSQDTLSVDPDLREINVRRLLILLRRLAYRVGVRYVFEPNNDSFRRAVQTNMQAVMENLYEKGALRGNTPSQAFRVNTGELVNTRQSVEAGRLFVELKVAPSLPMKFLTVRLVHIGERGFVIEGK